ncbi:hypothetical protein B0H14DRAFT_3439872 [Mycena olivaceomarginata]|nr:hypothetical protein B0H14DRAFT_3439872 [Mycena olivaceomarginata]
MSPGGADGAEGGKKEIAPKMIYGKSGAGKDAGQAQGARAVPDEGARAKKLPMEVVDAEYQWYIRFSFLTPRAMIAPVAPPGPPQAHILLCRPRNTGRHDNW